LNPVQGWDKLAVMSTAFSRMVFFRGFSCAGAALAVCLACGRSADEHASAGAAAKPGAERAESSASAGATPAKVAPDAKAAEGTVRKEIATQESGTTKTTSKEKRAIDPKTVGTIHGVIKLDGTPPERKEMAIGKTTGCEKHPVPPLTEDVIASDGKLANVFVYIKSGFEDWIVPPPENTRVVLDQEGCMYRTRVLGVRVGQKLAIKNSDPTNHNVHARPERNEGFNQTQATGSAPVEWQAVKPELMIPFSCDIHPWMKAWVSVREHPWFAVTGADGSFTIPNVPPGEYTIEAWHEKYGKKPGKLTLAPSGSADITLAFSTK
jgi:plastocyanin